MAYLSVADGDGAWVRGLAGLEVGRSQCFQGGVPVRCTWGWTWWTSFSCPSSCPCVARTAEAEAEDKREEAARGGGLLGCLSKDGKQPHLGASSAREGGVVAARVDDHGLPLRGRTNPHVREVRAVARVQRGKESVQRYLCSEREMGRGGVGMRIDENGRVVKGRTLVSFPAGVGSSGSLFSSNCR